MLPILERSRLVVMETEVLHRQCVGQITELWRAKQNVAKAHQAATEAASALRRSVAASETALRLQQEAVEALKRASISQVSAESRCRLAERALEQEKSRGDALQARLAAAPIPIPAPVQEPVVTPERDPVVDAALDSAEARFAMLDLD
jgi:predicted nucleic acid-binding protein